MKEKFDDTTLDYEKGYSQGWLDAVYCIAREMQHEFCDVEEFEADGCVCVDIVMAEAEDGWASLFNEAD